MNEQIYIDELNDLDPKVLAKLYKRVGVLETANKGKMIIVSTPKQSYYKWAKGCFSKGHFKYLKRTGQL